MGKRVNYKQVAPTGLLQQFSLQTRPSLRISIVCVGVWGGGRWLEDRRWMIEDCKAYLNPFDPLSSFFLPSPHPPILPNVHTEKDDYFLGMA